MGIVVLDGNNKAMASTDDAGAGEPERLSYSVTDKTGVFKIVVLGKTEGKFEGIFIGSEQIFFELESRYLIAGSTPPGEAIGYSYAGNKGETLKLLVTSDPKSPMDARISIFSFSDLKNALAVANDAGSGGTETLEFAIPNDGVYVILVSDASDKGGSFLMATNTTK